MSKQAIIFAIVLCLPVSNSQAAEWSGFAGLDTRFFTEPAAAATQNSSFADPSLMLQPEFRQEWSAGRDRFTAIPFARYDSLDTNRSHWDVREFNWLHKEDRFTVKAGVGKVFWGVTESRHLVDIVNQTDFVENLDSEEKLGQPMLNLDVPSDYGNFSLFYLPYFRERTFPAANGRLRFNLPVDVNTPEFHGVSRWHPDSAIRWSKTFGDWDVGVSNFYGLGREPRFAVHVPLLNNSIPIGAPTLSPVYDLIDQSSLDVQGAVGNWLFKLEAMTRSGQGHRFAALVSGFEYTQYGVLASSADLGWLMEYQYDGRDKSSPTALNPTAPPTYQDNNIFVGTRLTLNDTQNTQFLFGTSIQLNTQATLLSFEASRRLWDNWKVEIESRLFKNIPNTSILTGMSKDDYVQIRLIRFF
ncbi:hypothetical protein [Methylomonas sp. AM2-LC]|uniref:hypothetical protein n=1 Tax=Methylomonas sp. AM2-LC TaxID=3153301 RepID=UPI0032669D6C